MQPWPKMVEAFETSDGELHRTREAASYAQRRIDGAARATELLEHGHSLGEALREGGFLRAGVYPDLDEIFASTKLVIHHWQCSDKPSYQPVRVQKDGRVFVFGDAGSWSGPWGTPGGVALDDLVRYWNETKAARSAARRKTS